MGPHVIHTSIILFSGFLQKRGEGGIPELWAELTNRYSGRGTTVSLFSWCANTKAIANCLVRFRPENGDPRRIVIVGYSWGGQAAVNLCKQLRKQGVDDIQLILTDAVHRHWYWAGNWRAFWPGSTIKVPANVKHVWWGAQKNSTPSGHKIVVDKRFTKTTYMPCGDRTHNHMDEWPAFKRAVRRIVAKTLSIKA